MSTREILAKSLLDVEKKYNIIDSDEIAKRKQKGKQPKSKASKLQKKNVQITDTVTLPGKHFCDCQGTEHEPLMNCMHCGRITCKQEGSGPCSFCGNLVCTLEEEAILKRGGEGAFLLMKKLNPAAKTLPTIADVTADLQKALDVKDRLLEYQRESAQRTTVFDDQADYYNMTSAWINPEKKAQLQERYDMLLNKKYGSKLHKPVMLKFAGEEIVEENDFINLFAPNAELDQETEKGSMQKEPATSTVTDYVPQFVLTAAVSRPEPKTSVNSKSEVSRLQCSDMENMRDKGLCLSLHQPYASLLVRGIKRFEGRSWYTSHRGVLWIAATKKIPSNNDVTSLENFYRHLYNDSLPRPYPPDYPVGCLLGCVEVVDCLSQEDYRLQYPDGESESPYVLICKNARELPLKFPIMGRQKIYSLDPKIHQAAANAIEMNVQTN
ncbi:activating signal cointegrator 1 [Trichuris trichiura]|uniref:Activating signal cointegrator 1 n=1 Tax=Trichuris trichiura TaxID=36087 RepID=A0A077ZMD7_TRITR|nr:activating signal cointegrator 1 [Trichuris trichiura]